MQLWSPPTPPQDDSDLYIDYSLCFLYEQGIIPESELPAVYVKKEVKRTRADAGFFMDGRRPVKIRKEDNYFPPRSLFDRPSPALAKLRRDLKLQRYRGNFKPIIQLSGLKQQQQQQAQMPAKPLVEPEGMAEWAIYEDMVLLNIIQNMQGLPLNLMLLSPGHTPNWDLVADIVNQTSRVYRTPKQCRYRYEAVIVPREEGKLIENPKKQPKKTKNPLKAASPPKGIRALRTSQLFINDNNMSFTKMMKTNFDFIKAAFMKKAPQLKQMLVNPSMKNPKHASVLIEFGVTNYEAPLTPIEIAARRAEKMKERNRNLPAVVQQQQQQPQQQQQQQARSVSLSADSRPVGYRVDQLGSTPASPKQQQQAQQQAQAVQQPPELVQQQQATQQITPSQQTQQITTHLPNAQSSQQPTAAFVVQQQVPGVLPSVATIVQAAQSIQATRTGNVNISHQQQPQIVKVVAASPHSTNMLNTVQSQRCHQTGDSGLSDPSDQSVRMSENVVWNNHPVSNDSFFSIFACSGVFMTFSYFLL